VFSTAAMRRQAAGQPEFRCRVQFQRAPAHAVPIRRDRRRCACEPASQLATGMPPSSQCTFRESSKLSVLGGPGDSCCSSVTLSSLVVVLPHQHGWP
jgi:hypothetical protein